MRFPIPENIERWLGIAKRLMQWVVGICGILGILILILSFTSLPFWGYYWLGTSESEEISDPQFIIILGGSTMPGTSTLIRTYYGAEAAKQFTGAKIIIALPGDTADPKSSIRLMKEELVIRGISPDRILTEPTGTNTRFQVLEIKKMIQDPGISLLVVTSPEHTRRAVLTFKKVGFTKTSGMPAFNRTVDFNLNFNDKELGGKNRFLPEIGANIQIRYRMWQHLEYEILIARECLALGFYFLKGWI